MSAAAAGLLSLAFLTIRQMEAPVYRALPTGTFPGTGTDLSLRHARRVVGAEEVLCPSAGREVLLFKEGDQAEADFVWPLDRAHGDAPQRVWARVCRTEGTGDVQLSLNQPDGTPHAVPLPKDTANHWQWLDLGVFQPVEGKTGRLRLTASGKAAWQLMGLHVRPADLGAPPAPLTLSTGRVFREFGDRFDRSPGHGIGGWQRRSGAWEIEFSLDPNRIPMQYSLRAGPCSKEDPGLIVVDGPEWLGSRTSASVFLEPDSACGIAVETSSGLERYLVEAGHDGNVRPHQWHRLTLEDWGWTRRFLVDGKETSVRYGQVPAAHRPGLLLTRGEARFDDVRVGEIAWCAEDAASYQMPWGMDAGADWQRREKGRGPALRGLHGSLLPPATLAPVREVMLWTDNGGASLHGEAFAAAPFEGGISYRSSKPSSEWSVPAPGDITKLAVCAFAAAPGEEFRIGPYRFDSPTIPDPSDYLDFTAEEWEAIRTSPDADKLARKPKHTAVVGRSSEYAIWGMEDGHWRVNDGVLQAWRGGKVRFWQELDGCYTLKLRVRLGAADSKARILLGNTASVALRDGEPTVVSNGLALPAKPGEWTECSLTLSSDRLEAQTRVEREGKSIVGGPWSVAVPRGVGGELVLEADGRRVAFDDVEIIVPRRADKQYFHAFDRRETDWTRDGAQWIDHGGVSCALASNWVSLVAPAGRGMLWHKASFPGDVLLATNIEENTEWVGWEQEPSHIHYPFDNVVLCLADGHDPETGYRLEVNSRGRSATVLYRAGKEVASILEDARFPIQYRGGHAPYSPRRNRVCLVRQGDRVRALINGSEVLSYTDRQPLVTDSVGIGGYQTRVNFSRIMVRKLGTKR